MSTNSTDEGNGLDDSSEEASALLDDDGEEDSVKDGLDEVSLGHATFNRLVFPTAVLVLSVLYIENTFGRLSASNLRYPYFVIASMAVFTLWVYVDEIRGLLQYDSDLTLVESVRLWLEEWRLTIVFGLLTVLYIWLIDVIGFYSASFIGMTTIMYAAGVRNYKLMAILPVVIIIVIYTVFELVVLLRPPRGLIDGMVLF